jgi:hypothetical protein
MLTWLSQNLGTIFVAAIIIVVVALILRKMHSDKKSGKSSCGCDCGSCGMCSGCSGCYSAPKKSK